MSTDNASTVSMLEALACQSELREDKVGSSSRNAVGWLSAAHGRTCGREATWSHGAARPRRRALLPQRLPPQTLPRSGYPRPYVVRLLRLQRGRRDQQRSAAVWRPSSASKSSSISLTEGHEVVRRFTHLDVCIHIQVQLGECQCLSRANSLLPHHAPQMVPHADYCVEAADSGAAGVPLVEGRTSCGNRSRGSLRGRDQSSSQLAARPRTNRASTVHASLIESSPGSDGWLVGAAGKVHFATLFTWVTASCNSCTFRATLLKCMTQTIALQVQNIVASCWAVVSPLGASSPPCHCQFLGRSPTCSKPTAARGPSGEEACHSHGHVRRIAVGSFFSCLGAGDQLSAPLVCAAATDCSVIRSEDNSRKCRDGLSPNFPVDAGGFPVRLETMVDGRLELVLWLGEDDPLARTADSVGPLVVTHSDCDRRCAGPWSAGEISPSWLTLSVNTVFATPEAFSPHQRDIRALNSPKALSMLPHSACLTCRAELAAHLPGGWKRKRCSHTQVAEQPMKAASQADAPQ